MKTIKDKSDSKVFKFNLSSKIFNKLIILFAISVLILFSSYSWFAEKANPQITGNQIKVTVTGFFTRSDFTSHTHRAKKQCLLREL